MPPPLPKVRGIEMDKSIEKIALDAITKHFNNFIAQCVDANGKPMQPTAKSIAQARACIPKGHSMSFAKEVPPN